MRLALTVALATTLLTTAAFARKPEDVFAGRILLSDKAYPSQARSQSAYISALKKQSKDRFWEDKGKTGWKIHYAAFFQKPLNDLEVTVKFFDVTQGQHRLVEAYEQYLDSRGQRAIIGKVKLRKGEGGYEPNARILMVMENRGRILAKTYFYIQGEGRKFSGKVEFTEEETREAEPREE